MLSFPRVLSRTVQILFAVPSCQNPESWEFRRLTVALSTQVNPLPHVLHVSWPCLTSRPCCWDLGAFTVGVGRRPHCCFRPV